MPYFVDHTTGVFPQFASGYPWSAATMQVTGDTIADLTEDLAAEQKARVTYDNILRLSDDPDVNDVIKFLRAREIVHFQRFGEGLRLAKDRLDEKNVYYRQPELRPIKEREGVPADVLPMSCLLREQLREPPALRALVALDVELGIDLVYILLDASLGEKQLFRDLPVASAAVPSGRPAHIPAPSARRTLRGGPSRSAAAPPASPSASDPRRERGLRSCGKQRLADSGSSPQTASQ